MISRIAEAALSTQMGADLCLGPTGERNLLIVHEPEMQRHLAGQKSSKIVDRPPVKRRNQ